MKDNKKENSECKHDDFCAFAHTVCVDTDFKVHCRMKNVDITDMPLMEAVKKSYYEHKEKGEELQKKSSK